MLLVAASPVLGVMPLFFLFGKLLNHEHFPKVPWAFKPWRAIISKIPNLTPELGARLEHKWRLRFEFAIIIWLHFAVLILVCRFMEMSFCRPVDDSGVWRLSWAPAHACFEDAKMTLINLSAMVGFIGLAGSRHNYIWPQL